MPERPEPPTGPLTELEVRREPGILFQ